jgi:hypothetical protein
MSEDFDFFSSVGFDPRRLQARLPFLPDLGAADNDVWVHRKRDNLEAFVERRGPVKVSSVVWIRCIGLRILAWQGARACRWHRCSTWPA